MTDLARVACALERYRMSRGVFPTALADLMPDFLPVLPVEIVNGEPYRYRPIEDRFVLYSVGTDLRDDGGVINANATTRKQRDWVWRYPLRKAN